MLRRLPAPKSDSKPELHLISPGLYETVSSKVLVSESTLSVLDGYTLLGPKVGEC